jgi:hypothetical protein
MTTRKGKEACFDWIDRSKPIRANSHSGTYTSTMITVIDSQSKGEHYENIRSGDELERLMAIKFTNTPVRPVEPKTGKAKGSKKAGGTSNRDNSDLDKDTNGK